MASVSSLRVYPVKGAGGIELQQARIAHTGFAFDRNWVVTRNDKFESQRKDPKMALIKTSMPLSAFTDELSADSELALTLSVPGQEPIQVPVGAGRSLQRRQATVWEWSGEGFDEGDLVAEYLSDFMGHHVRLVRYAGQTEQGTPETAVERRALDRAFARSGETAFADAMPFLLTNSASLAELNSRCPEEVRMDSFRPNIVVQGAEAWAEDGWQRVAIGGVQLDSVMPTGRCTVTTVDQATGVPSAAKEPLTTLGTYRRGTQLGWEADRSWKGLVFFGWYLVAAQQGAVLLVGDRLEVLQRREGPPQKLAAAA